MLFKTKRLSKRMLLLSILLVGSKKLPSSPKSRMEKELCLLLGVSLPMRISRMLLPMFLTQPQVINGMSMIGFICMSMMHCFLSELNYGLRGGGGIGDFLPTQTAVPENRQGFYFRAIYDLSFFLLIITFRRFKKISTSRFLIIDCYPPT